MTLSVKYDTIRHNQETETTGTHDGLGDFPLKVSVIGIMFTYRRNTTPVPLFFWEIREKKTGKIVATELMPGNKAVMAHINTLKEENPGLFEVVEILTNTKKGTVEKII